MSTVSRYSARCDHHSYIARATMGKFAPRELRDPLPSRSIGTSALGTRPLVYYYYYYYYCCCYFYIFSVHRTYLRIRFIAMVLYIQDGTAHRGRDRYDYKKKAV